jgi:polyhydroxyalkanoate synthesis regulator phasin
VFRAVQRGLSFSLDARRMFERNVDRLLATINVPSQQDVMRLEERIERLDRDLERLNERLSRLVAAARRDR